MKWMAENSEGQVHTIRLEEKEAFVDDRSYTIESIFWCKNRLYLRVLGQNFEIEMGGEKICINGHFFQSTLCEERVYHARHSLPHNLAHSSYELLAPMPGKVLKVFVKQGDKVEKNQHLLVLEAMKMENELLAQKDGIITHIHVQPNQAVENGQKLLKIETG